MKLELEQRTQIQLNEPTTIGEPEVTEVSITPSFDLWTYHTSKANTQIEDRTEPIYQEVLIEYCIIL